VSPVGGPRARGGEQLMDPHQPQDALAADGEPSMSQARPDLAVAFAVERRRRAHAVERLDARGIAGRRLGAALRSDDGHDGPRRYRYVYGRARHPQDRADHRQRIAVARPRTHGASHRRCLFHSSVSPLFSMRYSANSNLIISSPIFARANVSSRSSGSLRVFSPRVPVSRNTRFQFSSSWARTWLSRDTASSTSPRMSRSTSSVF